MKTILLSLSLILLFGCDDEPNTFFSLGDFRVLALQADIPEIDGTSALPIAVQITPYISDVDAKGRDVSLKIHACEDPGINQGIEPTCDKTLSTTQTISYASINTSALGSRYTGALPAFTVNVPSPASILDQKTAQKKFNGSDYLVTVDFIVSKKTISVYKRIVVSENPTKNQNPKIKNVLVNELTSGNLKDKDNLSVAVTSGFEPETYDFLNAENQKVKKDEEYTISWFSYHGTTDLSRSFLNEKTTFEITKGKSDPFVVAILRDDRGGIDFQLRE